ncbi:MAG: outer membrane beta-barrel protein, partial [Myxococcales bacterium]|nr:outer membrane beta-barrel protein [Myxococcales bacterium]
SRLGRPATAALAALALAWSSPADAAPRDRPWGRGISVPSFGLGAGGFFSDVANVGFGLGFGYFIVNGLSVGLGFSDTILIYRSTIKAQYPGIQDGLPTNIFSITPRLQYVFFRSSRFSPYVSAGVGPVFFNHGGGTHGQWGAGPGVYINVWGPLYLDVGIGFSGMFPSDRCNDAWTYQSTTGAVALDVCSFQWGPRIGPVLAFGGRRRAEQRRRDREPPPEYYEPADNPMDEAVDEPTELDAGAPSDEAGPDQGAPSDVTPSEIGPDGGAPPDETGPDETGPDGGAPTDVAPRDAGGLRDLAPPPGAG